MDDGLETWPIFYLGIAELTSKRYHLDTDGRRGRLAGEPDVDNVIVGIDYHHEEGFCICDEDSNFCGIAMPGEDIARVFYSVQNFDEYNHAKAAYTEKMKAQEK